MARSFVVSGRLMRPILFAPLFAVGLVVPAAVAETDGACAHPSSAFRHAWCSGGVQRLEQELERVQRHVASGLQGPDKRALSAAQHDWSRSLVRRCPAKGDADAAQACLTDAYQARLAELKAIGVGGASLAALATPPLPVAASVAAAAPPVAQAPGDPAPDAQRLALAVPPPAPILAPTQPKPPRVKPAAPSPSAATPGEGTASPSQSPSSSLSVSPSGEPVKPAKAGKPAKSPRAAEYSPDQAMEMDKVARGENAVSWMAKFGGPALTSDTLRKEGWNYCALTLDDGPHPTWTPKVLEILRQERVVATYFVVGKPASQHLDIVKAFADEGHEIGNHSYSHPDLRKLTPEQQHHELDKTNEIIKSIGVTPKVFRPPFGAYNTETVNYIKHLNMDVALWSVDSRDWASRNNLAIVAKVKEQLTPAPIVLLHATLPATVEALPEVIAAMRARGCKFVTMSEWFAFVRTPPVKPTPTTTAAAAPALIAPAASSAPAVTPTPAPVTGPVPAPEPVAQ